MRGLSFRRGMELPARAKIVWVFAILHKSLCQQYLWPKWLRRCGEVVVYSPPDEPLDAKVARFALWLASVWQAAACPIDLRLG